MGITMTVLAARDAGYITVTKQMEQLAKASDIGIMIGFGAQLIQERLREIDDEADEIEL